VVNIDYVFRVVKLEIQLYDIDYSTVDFLYITNIAVGFVLRNGGEGEAF